MTPSLPQKHHFLFDMLRIRRVQERIERLYLQDQMKTPIHLCIGQEAIAVGVCAALQKEDYITSNHRGHGHYLAKGGDLKALIAELHCKTDGCARGYGGSMHLAAPQVGHLGSSSIVGGGIPIGTGLALSIQMQHKQQVSVIFFGDGAADEGVLYESVNFAILKQLPVVYILENNQWSVCSPVSRRQAMPNIFHTAPKARLFTTKADGNDVLRVYKTAQAAIDRARKGEGPAFIEYETYRVLGHAGCATQDAQGYRSLLEIDEWKARCPIEALKARLTQEESLDPDQLADMEARIKSEIDAAFVFAQKSPLPEVSEMQHCLFCGES